MTTKNELTIETITSMYGNDTVCQQIIKDHSCSCDSTQEAYNEGVNDGLYMGYKQGMKVGFELGRKGQGERVEALEAKIDELFATINDCFVEVGSIGHKASRVVKKLNEAASMPLLESPGE